MQSTSPVVRTLGIVLSVLGITFIVGLYPLTRLERGHLPGDVLVLLLIAVVHAAGTA